MSRLKLQVVDDISVSESFADTFLAGQIVDGMVILTFGCRRQVFSASSDGPGADSDIVISVTSRLALTATSAADLANSLGSVLPKLGVKRGPRQTAPSSQSRN